METGFDAQAHGGEHGAEQRAEKVARGQKTVIYALLLNIAVVAMLAVPGPDLSDGMAVLVTVASLLLRVVAFGMGIYGILTIGTGLGWSALAKVGTIILLILPLVNLITLLVVNGKATRLLKAAGYKVGLAGAYRPAESVAGPWE